MSYEKVAARLMNDYPGIYDLEVKAKKRLPYVAWEYLQTGTGYEQAIERNRRRLENISLRPRFMRGKLNIDLTTELFGKKYAAPFGVAPVGLTGMMWPKAEQILARMAQKMKVPFCLSTVATQIPEAVGKYSGDMGWFQLYPPKAADLRDSLLKRARDNGFHALVLTADVPAPSRRERTKRAGLKTPPKITPQFIWQGITHPAWSIATVLNGLPRLRTVESYSDSKDLAVVEEFVRFKFRGDLDWEYVKAVRDRWDGPMLLKGLLHPEDARQAVSIGVDGIGVSNHGGRQFDGAPAPIDILPEMVEAVEGKVKVIYDSGIRSGLDMIRAFALGADFVLCGRAYMYGVAALGKYGGEHTTTILMDDLKNNMAQLGIERIAEARDINVIKEYP
ncbi:MAG: alpha-hydroxy acid oxidase [Bacteroidia bacterium]|nr:alpha-hydroxy acid oxidase [Bacteroidia bacterium]